MCFFFLGTADSKAIQEWVGEAAGLLKHHKVLTGDYKYMKRLEYDIECNWKVGLLLVSRLLSSCPIPIIVSLGF